MKVMRYFSLFYEMLEPGLFLENITDVIATMIWVYQIDV
jgi:hypothetical protein